MRFFSIFRRKKINRIVQVYCEGCFEITDQLVIVTKHEAVIRCISCSKDRYYERVRRLVLKQKFPTNKKFLPGKNQRIVKFE